MSSLGKSPRSTRPAYPMINSCWYQIISLAKIYISIGDLSVQFCLSEWEILIVLIDPVSVI